MKTQIVKLIRRYFAYANAIYGAFVFVRDEFLPDELAQSLKLGKLIGRNLSMDNTSWIWFLLIAIIFYIPEIIDLGKNIFSKKVDVDFIPRSGPIHEGVWESYYAWLEIVGDLETEKYTAILKKLESEKNQSVTNHLVEITKSSFPRLKIIDEKLFVAETKNISTIISLKNGTSKPLPENVRRFYFEVDLMNGKKLISKFCGYLVGGYPDLHIESV